MLNTQIERYMFYNTTIKFLLLISLMFLFSCNKNNEATNNSKYKLENDTCNLNQLLDEYQTFVDQMNSAMRANDNTKILSINMDIQNWLVKWDAAQNDCTTEEKLSGTQKMLSIVNSINRSQ